MPKPLSVFGLGYVGCVSAACFAKSGHSVLGVDVNQSKVDLINAGKATIVEQGIGDLVQAMVQEGRLVATTEVVKAIRETAVSLVCVGTPSLPNGNIDLQYVERVCEEIGSALRHKAARHTVVIRSTVLPGTIERTLIPILERASGKRAGEGFGIGSNPEFLREGTSIKDFYDPPFTLIGAADAESSDTVAALYGHLPAPLFVTTIPVAEIVKYACNAFHGLKVGFANEVGNVCKALGIDSHEVMRIFCEDRKLNIAPTYLKPGLAFGGSCLPKDLRALVYKAKVMDVDTPLLRGLLESNRQQLLRALEMIRATGARRIAVLGMAFKAGTDDVRESPVVALIEQLLGKGYDIAVYDRDVTEGNLTGANRAFIEREVPHIWSLVRPTIDDTVRDADAIIIGNATPEFGALDETLLEGKIVIDLVRTFPGRTSSEAYQGICW